MKTRRICSVAVGLGLLGLLAQAHVAAGVEVKVLCSTGLKAVMDELVPQFERTTAHKVAITYGTAAALKLKIEAGEPFDLAVLTPSVIDEVIKQGRIAGDTRTPIARSGLGIAIRRGAPKPDISTVEAFTRALIGATSIAYVKEGASGVNTIRSRKRLSNAVVSTTSTEAKRCCSMPASKLRERSGRSSRFPTNVGSLAKFCRKLGSEIPVPALAFNRVAGVTRYDAANRGVAFLWKTELFSSRTLSVKNNLPPMLC